MYQVYALRYATDPNWSRGRSFYADPRPAEPQPMDFYSWLVVGGDGRAIAVDTGMRPEMAAASGYTFFARPSELVEALGVDPAAVETVVLTHLHFDHVGNVADFPRARFHLQRREMAYATGPLMATALWRKAYTADDTARAVSLLYEGRLELHDEEVALADGLSLHWVGGHTAGQEVVRVRTRRGWVVLAVDAIHYSEELTRQLTFSTPYSGPEMLAAHAKIRALADSDAHVIPGHDPAVMHLYPAAPGLDGRVVRLG